MYILIFLSIMGVLFIAGIIVLIVWLVKKSSYRSPNSPKPLDEARQRYARGEISTAEFEEIKRNLT